MSWLTSSNGINDAVEAPAAASGADALRRHGARSAPPRHDARRRPAAAAPADAAASSRRRRRSRCGRRRWRRRLPPVQPQDVGQDVDYEQSGTGKNTGKQRDPAQSALKMMAIVTRQARVAPSSARKW